MLKESDVVKLIFGLKIQHLRQEADMSYQQLSDRTGLAISYLHSIEKGKKYPKADKILLLSEALDTEYDYLVSLEPEKKLRPIVDLLRSEFLKIFPLETFGISTTKLVELLLQAPEKVNAFISTVIKITRNFNMQGEDFYKAALRSYQDFHDNYFPDIEKAVLDFIKQHGFERVEVIDLVLLEKVLREKYGIKVDRQKLSKQRVLQSLRSVYLPKEKTLCLGGDLSPAQERFLIAKELGFQHMNLTERPFETRMLEISSFEKLLANFHASYFAVALLLPQDAIIRYLQEMTTWRRWQGEQMLEWIQSMGVTPEMWLQRMANLLPRFFGVKQLFFLRFYTNETMQKFIVTKEMHLSQLHDPHANQLDEHYCRRWISIGIIRQLRALQATEAPKEAIIGAQISRYWNTPNAYFCIAIAKPTRESSDHSSSFTIGLLVNEQLRNTFPFLADASVMTKDVHTTCERCPVPDCEARVAAPVFLKRKQRKSAIREAIKDLQGRKIN
ncbi:MAG: helix-turn-helix domain-containing protein [Saprospiraceae bacterium]